MTTYTVHFRIGAEYACQHCLDTDSYEFAAICDRAIAKAKGGAA
jgi:hypothetical protein